MIAVYSVLAAKVSGASGSHSTVPVYCSVSVIALAGIHPKIGTATPCISAISIFAREGFGLAGLGHEPKINTRMITENPKNLLFKISLLYFTIRKNITFVLFGLSSVTEKFPVTFLHESAE